jgi:hypothetical protein
MNINLKPLSQVNHEAIQVLTERLGVVDALRFVSQFTTGHGDYTRERDALFDHLTLDDIVTAIEKKRASAEPPQPGATGPGLPKTRRKRR